MIKITTILLITVFFTLTNVNASQEGLEYSNPMPNLVRYTMGNAELLQLTKEQKRAIQSWTSMNKLKVKKLVHQVSIEEQILLKESLAADEDVLNKAEIVLDIRREIIRMKTLCRMNLKTILSPSQYSQLISIYIEEYYQRTEIIL